MWNDSEFLWLSLPWCSRYLLQCEGGKCRKEKGLPRLWLGIIFLYNFMLEITSTAGHKISFKWEWEVVVAGSCFPLSWSQVPSGIKVCVLSPPGTDLLFLWGLYCFVHSGVSRPPSGQCVLSWRPQPGQAGKLHLSLPRGALRSEQTGGAVAWADWSCSYPPSRLVHGGLGAGLGGLAECTESVWKVGAILHF